MAVFSSRPAGYKLGFAGLLFFTVVYLAGFSVPMWATAEGVTTVFGMRAKAKLTTGLWLACVSAEERSVECSTYDITNIPSWFTYVRIAACVALIFLMIACLYALASNCRTQPWPYSRRLESWVGSAGSIAMSSCIVFFIMIEDTWTYAYALYVTTAASGAIIICGFLIGCNNKPTDTVGPVAMSTMGAAQQGVSAVVVQNTSSQSASYPPASAYGPTPPAYGPTSAAYGPTAPVYHVPPPQPSDGYPPAYPPQYTNPSFK